MHRSRLSTVLIDHPAASYDASADFWAGAVGVERPGRPRPGHPYEDLGFVSGTVDLSMQLTTDESGPRVHVDVETDDVEAEVARLQGLGASVVAHRPEGHVIMSDPGGVVFCVVGVFDRERFEAHARTWP